jgi:hypothetical protein
MSASEQPMPSRSAILPVVPLALILAGAAAVQAQPAPGAFYIVDGQPIALTSSPRYLSVRARGGGGGAGAGMAARATRDVDAGLVVRDPSLAKHGLVLVRIPPGTDPATLKGLIGERGILGDMPDGNPVYAVGDTDLVLVNEVSVQVRDEVSAADAKALLATLDASVISADMPVRNRYLVTFPGRTATEALNLANQLATNSLVRFAEPNFLLIIPRLPAGDSEEPER